MGTQLPGLRMLAAIVALMPTRDLIAEPDLSTLKVESHSALVAARAVDLAFVAAADADQAKAEAKYLGVPREPAC